MFQKILDNYKIASLVSALLLFAILGYLFYNYQQTGELVEKGLDFKGGTQIVITDVVFSSEHQVEGAIKNALGQETVVKFAENGKNIIIESEGTVTKEQAESILKEAKISYHPEDISRIEIGASLSSAFLNQARKAILIAFIAMSIVVFITFRAFVPSAAVILAGLSDIATAVAGMNILGIKLSLSTLAALMILIGYSVDTDILLTTRVLKNRSSGSLNERITHSFKTGMTMTICAIASMVVLFLVSSSAVLDDIALVIIMGLVADIPFTWVQNVSILKWYAVKRNIE